MSEYHKDADLAYLAGLIDGEGCIRVGKFKNSAGALRYRASCVIAMTDGRPLKWVKNNFGGGLYVDRKLRHRCSKVCHSWMINAQSAATILRQCLPFLKVKHRQARLLIEFAATLRTNNERRHRRMPAKLLETRKRLADRSTALNMKGRA